MAGFTASWVHGHAVVMEQPPQEDGGVFGFNHFGWGTQIVMRPGFARWFHIPIPTPVILDGKRMKLIRFFLQYQQIQGYARSGYIADVHLWDGRTRKALASANDFKSNPDARIDGHVTYEPHRPIEWWFGLGVSFRLGAHGNVGGHFVDNEDAPVLVIGSAGADFEV